MTLYLAPFGFILSWFDMLPISCADSIAGATGGYLFLFTINYVFKYLRNQNGIGEGDFDLLFLIGAFTGVIGSWASITIGSAVGSVCGLLYSAYAHFCNPTTTHAYSTKIPFGPFLALGALTYIFGQIYLY